MARETQKKIDDDDGSYEDKQAIPGGHYQSRRTQRRNAPAAHRPYDGATDTNDENSEQLVNESATAAANFSQKKHPSLYLVLGNFQWGSFTHARLASFSDWLWPWHLADGRECLRLRVVGFGLHGLGE